MKFSIITPSFRSLRWLKLCVASVADQGVDCEHLVQDSCSDDGTPEWLRAEKRVTSFIEKDKGMYDAVNRGLQRATGDILAYLNCDEQYLPGALNAVEQYFQSHPECEVVFADALIVDERGDYVCHRQALLPRKHHTLVSGNLAIITCATFFRRSLIANRKLLFNPTLKDLGDADWVLRLLDNGVRLGVLRFFTSTFTDTGANMNLLPNAQREKLEMFKSAPLWARYGKLAVILHHRLRRFYQGHYRQLPAFDYSLYISESPTERVIKRAAKPTYLWVRKPPPDALPRTQEKHAA